MLVVRETASGRARGDWNVVGRIWRWSLRVVLAGSALVIVAAEILIFAGSGQLPPAARWTLLWVLPLIPLLALSALHRAAQVINTRADCLLLGLVTDTKSARNKRL